MALNNLYALSFDGIDDRVDCGNDSILKRYMSDFTIEAYIKLAAYPASYVGPIISNRLIGTGGSLLFIRGEVDSTNKRKLAFDANLSTGTRMVYSQIQLALNTIYHVAVTFKYNGGNLNSVKLYINGNLEGSSNTVSNIGDPSTEHTYLGYESFEPEYRLNGIIDEVRIWNRVLTQNEILNKMYKRLQGNELGLIAYYRFDEGSGSITYDASPNANNGTIYGASWVSGLVDLDVGAVTLSATAYSKAIGMVKFFKGRTNSATAHSHTTFTSIETTRIKGLRVITSARAVSTAKPQKTAIARATGQGRTMAGATALVLFIPPGVYSIDANNIFNRNQPITPDSLANYIEVWVNPLKPVDVAEEVYKTDEADPISISAGETKTVTIYYKKEPVTDVTINLLDAPTYATITNIKHYAWGADVTVASPDTGTFKLVATGKPLEVQGRELIVKKDETSILENGIKKYIFDNEFVQDRTTAEMIANKLLSFAIPQADIEIDWRGDPALVLADVVMIPEFQRQGLDQRGIFYVTEQEFEFDGGLRARLKGRKMS